MTKFRPPPAVHEAPARISEQQAVLQTAKFEGGSTVFLNRRSGVVRSPKEFHMLGDEVPIRREGKRIPLKPIKAALSSEAAWLAGLAKLAAMVRSDPQDWSVSDLMRDIREER